MDDFVSRVREQLKESVRGREYHELADGFSITRTETGPVVEGRLALKEIDSDISVDQWEDTMHADVYEDISTSLADPVATEATQYLDAITDVATFTEDDAISVTAPKLWCIDPDKGVSAIIDFHAEWDEMWLDFEAVAKAVAVDPNAMIDAPSRITSVSVQSPLYDPRESENTMHTRPDYTVRFTTDEPHTMWSDCDTLEEYAEMVAENNDEYTVADVLAWDTYTNHFHITGEVAANGIVRAQTERAVDRTVSVTTDSVERRAQEFGMNGDTGTVWLTGSVAGWSSDLPAPE